MSFLRPFLSSLFAPDRVLLVALAATTTAPFAMLFATPGFALLAAGAALLALVLAALCGSRSLLVASAVGVAGLAAYLVWVVFHVGVPIIDDLSAVWAGVNSSWHETLATALPAPATPTLFALPVVLAWSASFAGVELASRTRLVALPAVPALAAFLVGLLLTGQRPGQSLVPAVLLLTGALAIILLRNNAGERSLAMPTAGTNIRATLTPGATNPRVPTHLRVGLPVLAGVSLVALASGVLLPLVHDDERVDLRERYEAPLDQLERVTPLEPLSAELNDTSNPLLFKVRLSVRGGDRQPIDRIRIASLDVYDGTVWDSSARLSRIGEELPPGPVAPTSTVPVDEEVTLAQAYRSDFLPNLDRPVAISGEGLWFDRQSGMVVLPTGPVAGYRLHLTSAVPQFDDAQLRAAPAGNDPSVADMAQVPVGAAIPSEITAYAQQTAFARPTPYESLRAIENDLRTNGFGYDKKTPPGHSLAAVQALLRPAGDDASSRASHVGDAEQFAAAFALVARIKGFASRVVVGYRLDPRRVATGDELEVHANDIHAWTEVNLRGVGWVPFDGTNADNPGTAAPPPPTTVAEQRTPASTSANPAKLATASSQPSCDVVASAACDTEETIVVWWPIVPAMLLVVLPILIVVAKRLRRRARRRRGPPARRVIGAWRETTDRLLAFGTPTSSAMTPAELVTSLNKPADSERARRLSEFGPLLDVTLYDRTEPDDELAEQAWNAEAGVADALHATTGRLRRATAVVDPRPLLVRRRLR